MPDQAIDLKPSEQFAAFVRVRGAALRANDVVPSTLEEWIKRKESLRAQLQRSWGDFPKERCPLEPRTLGELKRDGYRVEKIVLQTRPGIEMTANAYVPDGGGKRAAVLCVHGHWRGAKQDPVPQARCIGLAKLGFFVLVVDAFGAGERGLSKRLGEYHGEMVAATLFPTGLALAGLQVYENMRAVDYLQSRPEVDGTRIGITGASGGGNQTMYAGAYDERFRCVVPTCSVGTYQSYLTAACCMCELVPSAVTYTEEWGLLSMVAPRGLMVISATQDSFQFSVGEARKSLAPTRQVFELFGKPANVAHAVFESKHDYNQAMREAMYGWMTLHLKEEGDGKPISEPPIAVEDPESLRCYPGTSRPETFVTLPQFAAAQGREILARRKLPDHREHWDSESQMMTEALYERVLGRFPEPTPLNLHVDAGPDGRSELIRFEPEPGLTLAAHRKPSGTAASKLAILLHPEGQGKAAEHPLANELNQGDWDVVTLDLRATGGLANPNDAIMNATDHNSAQWSVWIGRPLLGQWVWDIRRLLDALDQSKQGRPKTTALIGLESSGIVALCAAALDRRVSHVVTVGALATFVSAEPYRNQRFGIMAPGLLRDVGDVQHLAALSVPRRLIIAGGVLGNGDALKIAELKEHFQYTRRAYGLGESPDGLSILAGDDVKFIAGELER
ncbi:MAG: alpha/beta hydrolase family protein [Planctomycetaceae bacterium]